MRIIEKALSHRLKSSGVSRSKRCGGVWITASGKVILIMVNHAEEVLIGIGCKVERYKVEPS